MHKFLLTGFFLLFTTILFAQNSEPGPMETDRPSQADAAILVPQGTFQVEAGFLYQNDEVSGFSEKEYRYPAGLVRIGILKKAELRFSTQLKHKKITFKDTPDSAIPDLKTKTGFDRVAIGTKIQLLESNGSRPDLAFQIESNLPVGSKQYKPDSWEPQLRLAANKDLSDKLALFSNLGFAWEENEDSNETRHYDHIGFYALGLDYKITDKFKIFGEAFGLKQEGKGFAQLLDAGFAILVLPNLQFDAFSGIGITEDAPDFFAEAGLSFRLPK